MKEEKKYSAQRVNGVSVFSIIMKESGNTTHTHMLNMSVNLIFHTHRQVITQIDLRIILTCISKSTFRQ